MHGFDSIYQNTLEVSVSERQKASKNCSQSCCKWPILCELRLSVDAWIRTCKAGLVQVLIGLVKHIRCWDFEMSLTPIILWHYSQACCPQWDAGLSTTHWRKRTTSVAEHLITMLHQVYFKEKGEAGYWAAILCIYTGQLSASVKCSRNCSIIS